MKKITIYFPKKLFKKLKTYCREQKTSISDFLINLINEKYINANNIIKLNDVNIKDEEPHPYVLRLSDEFHKDLELKMVREKDNNKSKICINLVKDFFS